MGQKKSNCIYGWEWNDAVAPLLEQIDRHVAMKEKLNAARSEVETLRKAMQGLTIKPGTEARLELETEQKAAEANLQARQEELERMMGNLSVSFPRSFKQRAVERRTEAFMPSVGDKRFRETSGSPESKPQRSMSVLRVIIFYVFVV